MGWEMSSFWKHALSLSLSWFRRNEGLSSISLSLRERRTLSSLLRRHKIYDDQNALFAFGESCVRRLKMCPDSTKEIKARRYNAIVCTDINWHFAAGIQCCCGFDKWGRSEIMKYSTNERVQTGRYTPGGGGHSVCAVQGNEQQR